MIEQKAQEVFIQDLLEVIFSDNRIFQTSFIEMCHDCFRQYHVLFIEFHNVLL